MTDARAGTREWAGLAALALPTFLIGLDLTVLHLAVPEIVADLRPSATAQLWIVDVYGFAVAGLLLTMGGLGDRIGRRRLLLTGAAGFAAASVLAAFATSPGLLIAARALLGLAGATLMPSTLSLIRDLFPRAEQRTVAISVWMAALLTGTALGPLIGGLLLEAFWWGSVFLLAVPVMVGLLLVGPWLLPAGQRDEGARVDPRSVLLSLVAVLAVVYAIKDAAAHGAGIATAPLVLASVAAGTAFVRRQRRLADPLLDVSLFRDARFSVPVLVQLGALLSVVGTQYLTAQYLQLVLGLSPLHAGLWTLPAAALGLLGAFAAPAAAARLGPRATISAGLLIAAAGLVVLARVPAVAGIAFVVVGGSLAGFAMSLVNALTTDSIVGAAPPSRAGMASGVSETSAELGIALGIALLGSLTAAVQGARTDAPLVPGAADAVREAFTSGLRASAIVGAVVLALLAVLAARRLSRQPA